MKFGVNDIVTFEGEGKFAVLAKVFHEQLNYYYLVGVNAEENDLIEDVMIVKDSDDGNVLLVHNEEEIKTVQPILTKSIQINFNLSQQDIQSAIEQSVFQDIGIEG